MAYKSEWVAQRDRILGIANQVKDANPDAWNALKIHGTPDRRYINLVSAALIAAGIPGGVNQKRGHQGDSIDALALPNASGAKDAMGVYPGVEIIDIVGGAEGGPDSTPRLTWGDVTQVTIDKGEVGGWKAGSGSSQPAPVPQPQPPARKPRPQFASEFGQVNAFYAAQEGLQRVGGMVAGVDASVFSVLRGVAEGSITDLTAIQNACRDVLKLQCDVPSMIAWGYDLMNGAKVEDVIKQIRNSDEWKAKHQGETP